MIIGITGDNGIGKDTVGLMLKKHFGGHIKKFSTLPVGMYKQITGIDFHKLSRDDKEAVRDSFEQFAEGVKNILTEDVWADALLRDYTEDCIWIITDVRFSEEAQRISDLGGTLVRIVSDTIRDPTEIEKELDEWRFDHYLGNNSSLDELQKKVNSLCKQL